MNHESSIIAIMPKIRTLALAFARDYQRDPDDLFSIGMIGVCEASRKETIEGNPIGFFYRAARYRIINEVQRNIPLATMSLDAPIHDDSATTLADVLSFPTSIPTAKETRIRALYDAVSRLSPRSRQVVMMRYGLGGYGVTRREDVAMELGVKPHAVSGATRYGLQSLAKDAQLCAEVGVR